MTIADTAVQHQSVSFFGLQGAVTQITFSLDGLSHGQSSDLLMLLVGPDGSSNLEFWGSSGGGGIAGGDFTISDAGSASLPSVGSPASGSYVPTVYNDGSVETAADFGLAGFTVVHAGPVGTGTFASAFSAISPNGSWSFHLADAAAGSSGSLDAWSITVDTTSDDVAISGTAGNDVLTVSFTGADSGTYSLNGGPTVAFSGITSLSFSGLDGDDRMIIQDAPTANVAISFDGGANNAAGGDTFELQGSAGSQIVSLDGLGAGNVSFGGGLLSFFGTEAVDNSVYTSDTTIALSAGADDAMLTDNGNPVDGSVQVTSACGAFPDVVFKIPSANFQLASGVGDVVVVDVAEDFGSANVTIGSPTDDAANPDAIYVQQLSTGGNVSLFSNGEIAELGYDQAADITANMLLMSAGAGIGGPFEELEVDAVAIEAATQWGDIALFNWGDVTIGGVTPDLDGLSVAAGGSIFLGATGTISLGDASGSASIQAGALWGDVTIQTAGKGSKVVLNEGSVSAADGDVNIISDDDIEGGVLGAVDVQARGDVQLLATGDIVLQDGTSVTADEGDVLAFTGFKGALRLLDGASIVSSLGNVVAVVDKAAIEGAIAAGLSVNLTGNQGRPIILGSTTDSANALELSGAELDRITTGLIVIGDPIGAGSINVTGSLQPANASGLVLQTGGNITVGNAGYLGVTQFLGLNAGGDITVLGTLVGDTIYLNVDSPDFDPGIGSRLTMLGTVIPGIGGLAATGGDDDDVLQSNTAGTLEGYCGNDTYIINSSKAVIIEYAGEGTADRALTSVSYSLGAGVDVEFLSTTSATGTASINLAGNSLVQTITGNAGANQISDGGGSADTLIGLGGNDTYFVHNSAAIVVERPGEGTDDWIATSKSYTLAAGVAIERLSTISAADTSPLKLIGNEFAQIIKGNAGDNQLGDGGGAGADTLIGLGGNDTYYVRNAGTVIVETSSGGANDQVAAAVSYTLGAGVHVERLTTISASATTPINLTGNAFSQTIVGNAGANVLNDGGGAADIMIGGGGDDTYYVNNSAAVIIENWGGGDNDRVLTSVSYALGAGVYVERLATSATAGTAPINLTGNERGQIVMGNNGDNILSGKLGNDTLVGGLGADTFVFDTAPDTIANNDKIVDFSSIDDTIQLAKSVFSAIVGIGTLTSAQFHASALGIADTADNRIIYNTTTGALTYDADGNGSGTAVQFASLVSAPTIHADDFFLV